jgi:hypothetical protein
MAPHAAQQALGWDILALISLTIRYLLKKKSNPDDIS